MTVLKDCNLLYFLNEDFEMTNLQIVLKHCIFDIQYSY